jgi:hypothetical protein
MGEIHMELFRLISTVGIFIALMVFILALLKRILDFRIKNRIAEKGVSESLATSLLSEGNGNAKTSSFKWFAILAGAGVGLTIVNYTMPLGIHSLAIMSFSIAGSFLVYYFFIRKNSENG